MRKLLTAAAALVLVAGCTAAPADVIRVVEAQGMTDVTVGGHRFTGCGQDDTTATGFTATGANGRPVSGVVCGQVGPFSKSFTVRID